jgi:hypothetical protein
MSIDQRARNSSSTDPDQLHAIASPATPPASSPATPPASSPATPPASSPATPPASSPATPLVTSQASSPGEPRRFDLSLAQIVGGALAAMTAASLGSRLGVAGTIVGAALASIVAAVAGALYTASLRHTQHRVKTVFTGRIAEADGPSTGESLGQVTVTDAASALAAPIYIPRTHTTRVHPISGRSVLPPLPPGPPLAPPARAARRFAWQGVVAGALAAFGLAAAALTGFEYLSGAALSGGTSTTIEQVSQAKRPSVNRQTEAPAANPSNSSEPSERISGKPSEAAEPSATPSAAREPTPSVSSTPQLASQPPSQPSSTTPPSSQPSSPPPSTTAQPSSTARPSSTPEPSATAPPTTGTATRPAPSAPSPASPTSTTPAS